MNDRDIRESGHLMLITPERVFYAGLLGRPRERCSGAIHIYVAIEGGLRLAVAGGGGTFFSSVLLANSVAGLFGFTGNCSD